MFSVTILGNNSALPAYDRHPTSQVVTLDDQLFLVDCGEGTQMQMARYKIHRGKINYIFISHLHGDHYYGLIGLLTSMGLLGRTKDLHIFAPEPLESVLRTELKASATELAFKLIFHSLSNEEGLLLETDKIYVECFKTTHKIPCWGYIFRKKDNKRKLIKEKLTELEIPQLLYESIKNGNDYTDLKGRIIPNDEITVPPAAPASYAFAADTRYDEHIAECVTGVSLLYHETTYLDDMRDKAYERYHSTTLQAARIAQKANVGKLLIGHFSSKYEKIEEFLTETQNVFERTELSREGSCIPILPVK